MALTRAMLKGMGLTEEQVSAIIEEHTNVTSSLKDQIKEYKVDAEKLPQIQQELDNLKNDTSASEWEKKYNDEHASFEKYKTDVADKEKAEKIKSAYRGLLSECKVGDRHLDSIIRVTDFSNMQLNDKGSFDDVDALKEKIKDDWGGFISVKETRGAEMNNPPDGGKKDDESKNTGRAAQLAAKYHDNLYGVVK